MLTPWPTMLPPCTVTPAPRVTFCATIACSKGANIDEASEMNGR